MCFNKAFIAPKDKCYDDDLQVRFHRECTNFYCLLIFLCFWIYFIVVFSYGVNRGKNKLDLLWYGVDYEGNICGKDIRDRRYVYYPILTEQENRNGNNLFGICVNSCPKENEIVMDNQGNSFTVELNTTNLFYTCLYETYEYVYSYSACRDSTSDINTVYFYIFSVMLYHQHKILLQ